MPSNKKDTETASTEGFDTENVARTHVDANIQQPTTETDPNAPPVAPNPADVPQEHWELRDWKGVITYHCSHCPRDFTDEPSIRAHIIGDHRELAADLKS